MYGSETRRVRSPKNLCASLCLCVSVIDERMSEPLLQVEHLTTGFPAPGGDAGRGQRRQLLDRPGRDAVPGGRVRQRQVADGVFHPASGAVAGPHPGRFDPLRRTRPARALGRPRCARVRGADIALIFQEPMTALNPVFTVGDQIAEALVVHGRMDWRAARAEAVRLMDAVRIPDAAARARDYPHQLSGGQRQRVLIAMALACKPALVIADEPTTALDVTIQAQILDLLRQLQAEHGLALLLITHDLGVVAEMADRVAVMYAGRIVEQGPVDAIFASPQHPYTKGLLASLPGVRRRSPEPAASRQAASGHRRDGADAGEPAAWLRVRAAVRGARRRLPRGGAGAGHARTTTGPPVACTCSHGGSAAVTRAARSPQSDEAVHAVQGLVRQAVGREGRRRRVVLDREGRDVRAGRRVGQRQDDDGPLHSPADRTDVRRGAVCRRGRARLLPSAHARRAARHADRLSGSVRVAQPAHAGRRHRRGAARHPQGGHGRRAPHAGRGSVLRWSDSTRAG